jgi:GTP cyclohydrolase I
MVEFTRLPSKATDEDGDDINRPPSSISSDNNAVDGNLKRKSGADGQSHESKKKKRKQKSERVTVNGGHKSKRSHSGSKPARDPRDEASPPRSSKDIAGTRSPSPVIDFDGLSRPSRLL